MKVGFRVYSRVTGQPVAPEARNAWERRHLAQCHSVIFPRRCDILGIAVVRPATCQPGGLPDISRGLSGATPPDAVAIGPHPGGVPEPWVSSANGIQMTNHPTH